MQRQSEAFDAIVVGSGISGGWAAKELTERGLRVLMLERGKDIEHIKDYPSARKAPWEYPHRGGRTHAMEEAYPVLKRDYPLGVIAVIICQQYAGFFGCHSKSKK